MDNALQPNLTDQPQTVPAAGPEQPQPDNPPGANGMTPGQPQKRQIPSVIIAAGIIFLGILLLIFYLQTRPHEQVSVAPTGTPTQAPSPTPIRELSEIATTSLFTELTDSIASLSASLNAYNVQDPELSPPSLVLPLGF